MPKSAAYLRVSSADQRERESILSQELVLRQHFEREGIDTERDVLWYRDDGVSGEMSMVERGEGALLIEDVRAGLISRVYTFSISRLTRDAPDYFAFARVMQDHEVPIIAVTQGVNTAQEGGEFVAGILALVAAKQRRDQMIAAKAGHDRVAKAGRWQGMPPYGYLVDDEGRLIIHPTHAEVVREIFRLYLQDRLGGAGIAEALNDQGVPAPRGGPRWNNRTVLRILRNPAYRGEARYNTTAARRRGGKLLGRRERPETEHIVIPCEPLLEPAAWYDAERLLARRTKLYRKDGYAATAYILPRVRCAVCGGRYYPDVAARRSEARYHYYRHNHRGEGRACAGYACLRREEIEPQVWARLLAVADDPEGWQQEIAREWEAAHKEGGRGALEAARLAERITETQAAITRLDHAYVMLGTLTPAAYEAMARELGERLARLSKEQSRLNDVERRASERQQRTASLADLLREARALLDDPTIPEQRAIVDEMVSHIVLDARLTPPAIEIVWSL